MLWSDKVRKHWRLFVLCLAQLSSLDSSHNIITVQFVTDKAPNYLGVLPVCAHIYTSSLFFHICITFVSGNLVNPMWARVKLSLIVILFMYIFFYNLGSYKAWLERHRRQGNLQLCGWSCWAYTNYWDTLQNRWLKWL